MKTFIPEINTQLLPEEIILYETKKHIILFITPVIWTLATLVFLMMSNEYITKITFVPAIIALCSWINELLNYYIAEFVITNKRILMREGFFFKHTNEMRLSAISNVTVNQSFLGQLLQYGTVIIYPFSGDKDPFLNISDPTIFQKKLQEQLDKLVKQ